MEKPAGADVSKRSPKDVLIFAVSIALVVWLTVALFGPGMIHSIVGLWAEQETAEQTAAPASLPTTTHKSAAAPKAKNLGPTTFTQLGQAGDAFGGINALFSCLAGALVFWAGYMQWRTLDESKAALTLEKERAENEKTAANEARTAYGAESKSRSRQQFETTFFELLSLTRSIEALFVRRWTRYNDHLKRDRARLEMRIGDEVDPLAISQLKEDLLHLPSLKEPRFGREAISAYASRLNSWVRNIPAESDEIKLRQVVDAFYEQIYSSHPSTFGPYFRVLYQTFKHVDESGLDEKEKIRFANIARGQISEGVVLLLAANGLGPWGYKFVPYIEKFGLLEHMHRRYRERYKNALLVSYRERAFQGSEEREPIEQLEVPRHPPGYFCTAGADGVFENDDRDDEPPEFAEIVADE